MFEPSIGAVVAIVGVLVFVVSYYRQPLGMLDDRSVKPLRQPLLDGAYFLVFGVLIEQTTPPYKYGVIAIFLYGLVGYWLYRVRFTVPYEVELIEERYNPIETVGKVGYAVVPVLGLLLLGISTTTGRVSVALLGLTALVGFVTPLIPRTSYEMMFGHRLQKLSARTWILTPQVAVLLAFLHTYLTGSLSYLAILGLMSPAITCLLFKLYYTHYRKEGYELMYADWITPITMLNYSPNRSLSVNPRKDRVTLELDVPESMPEECPKHSNVTVPWNEIASVVGVLSDSLKRTTARYDQSKLDSLFARTMDYFPTRLVSNSRTNGVRPAYQRTLHRQDDTTLQDIYDVQITDNLLDGTNPSKNYTKEEPVHERIYEEPTVDEIDASVDVETSVGDDGTNLKASLSLPSAPSVAKLMTYVNLWQWIRSTRYDSDDLPPVIIESEEAYEFKEEMYDVAYELYEETDDVPWVEWRSLSRRLVDTVQSVMHRDSDVSLADIHEVDVIKSRRIVEDVEEYG